MFARTRRLTLRPGWPEDAAALAHAIAHEAVVTRLARVPWPYGEAEAAAYLAAAEGMRFMICAHEPAAPRLIGSIALAPQADSHELGYWLTPDAWGRGYATEAAHAVVEIARHALPIRRLTAACAPDNPSSARVLHKLGFRDTGRREFRPSRARNRTTESIVMELDVGGERQALPIAA